MPTFTLPSYNMQDVYLAAVNLISSIWPFLALAIGITLVSMVSVYIIRALKETAPQRRR